MNLLNKKTEEIVKWRQQDIMNYNHGENSPSFLSSHQEISSITTAVDNANSLNSPLKNTAKFYITLAKESPIHDENDSDISGTYDSCHDRTTDLCMDSETESNSSEYSIQGIATLEVVEYEVRSASASEDLYSNDSSSGTDEDLIEIAKEILQSKLVGDNNRSGCGFWSSDFADTEESDTDNCIDYELNPADYWYCVKCKNRQNNPMFRYCEKCYQIRKTHFPPRPTKSRKSRKNRKRKSPIFNHNSIDRRRKSGSTKSNINSQNELTRLDKNPSNILNQQITSCNPTAATSNDEIGKNNINLTNSNIIKFNKMNEENSKLNIKINNSRYKKRKLNFTNNNISQLNSSAESYSDDDYTYSSDSSFENLSKSANITFNNSSLNNRKRKATIVTDGDDIDSEICSQAKMKFIDNQIKPNSDINLNSYDSETDLVNNHNIVNSIILFEKDSGISSAPSTQDYGELSELPHCSTSTDEKLNKPNTTKLQKINSNKNILTKNSSCNNKHQVKDDGNESSDTISEELNEKDIVELEDNVILSPQLDESIHLNNKISKSINNNYSNNEIKQNIPNNLDRHLSEFSPITNKTNHDSVIPRSTSVNNIDHCNTNLRIIESSQSPSTTIALKNCTTNFDDKLSLLSPSDNQIDSSYGLCIICVNEPKNGAFVHNRFVHLSCCYKCAVKIWNKNKKCPICNCAVKNVMKLFVH